MKSIVLALTVVFVISLAASPTLAAPPSQAIDAYVKAYTQMGKNAAVMFAQENTRANARTNQFKARVDAWCKIVETKSKWITAVATANSTNAKTLVTLQEVRSKALDNNLKVAKTFYDKRALHAGYQGLNTRKRPTQEDVIRYSKTPTLKRPASFQLTATQRAIHWPEALQDEDFFDCRVKLDSLFTLRRSVSLGSSKDISHEVQGVTTQMRELLRSKIHDMSPQEYLSSRKFLASLVYEATFPPHIGGFASN